LQRAQLSRVLPELLLDAADTAPGVPFTEAAQKRQFFEALSRAVLKPAMPVLLAIDDLQWCDLESIEWLHYLLRFDPAARLLIAATVRADEAAPDRMGLRDRALVLDL